MARIRIPDQYLDSVGQPWGTAESVDVLTLPADAVIVSGALVSTPHNYTVASKAATVDLSATTAYTFAEAVTVTAVTYTPVSTINPPSTGDSRTWLVKQGATTIATLVIDENSTAKTGGQPVSFTINHGPINVGAVTLESTHVGTGGLADPGGTLILTEVF